VLAHLGILAPAGKPASSEARTLLRVPGRDGFVLATRDGVFEPFHALGAEVHAGEAAGRIHNLGDPSRGPETLHFAADGIVYGRRQPGRVVTGNCCVTVAARYP
jgi:N-alpha-acetyl-L-2,4-diaminobutyrate deacetylase